MVWRAVVRGPVMMSRIIPLRMPSRGEQVEDRLTVLLNNHMVLENARLPEIPARGRLALQHHGGINKDGSFKPASSLIQFRNIWIKELPTR